ncbi:MAG: hypothetical protein ACYC9M_02555 [Desulfobulbaceae bacterium]
MPKPSPEPRRKWLLPLCCAAAFILLLAATLPLQVEHFFLPRILENAGLAGYRVAVSRFGLRGCTLHLAAAPENGLVRSGTLDLDWTIAGLLRGRLRRLTGDGLLVNPTFSAPQPPAKKTAGSDAGGLPLLIDRIELRNSFIALPRKGRSFLLPLSFSGQRQEQATGHNSPLRYKLNLRAGGQEIHADFTLDQAGLFAGTAQTSLDLSSMTSLPLPGRGQYQGSTGIDAELAGALRPFRLDKIAGTASLSDFQANWGQALLESAGENAARITLSGGNGTYRLSGSDFTLAGPLTADLAFTSEIFPEDGAIRWQGEVTLQPAPGQQFAEQASLDKVPTLHLRHKGKAEAGRIEIDLQAGPREGQEQQGYALRLREKTFQAEGLSAEARIVVSPESADQWLTATFGVKSGLAADFGNGRGRVPALVLQGSAILPAPTSGRGLSMQGRLDFTDASLSLIRPEIDLQAVNLALPFSWPGQEQANPGELHIKDISLGKSRLAGFSGAITREANSFSLQGEVRSALLPGSAITVIAGLQPFRAEGLLAEVSWSADQARLAVQELALLHPTLKSLTGTATLDLDGRLRFDQCGLHGDLAASLQDGDFALPEANLHLTDVALDLRLPRLPDLESEPAQHLAIGALNSKKIAITNLTAAFRVESPASLFIEDISAGWSGGRVFSSGLRLQKNLPELAFALICDHLQLAEVLTQLGLAEAEGGGSVSGRIPVVYRDRKLRVDDGFLFTAPGDKGTLKIIRSSHLDVGLPPETPQLSPLHFAGAALRDFEYNWAKLNIFSEEENLLLKLQIDGRPRQRLPYRFDADNSVFVRLAERAPGGIDQPVKLDVNFKVPVNELMRNQQILQPLLRKLK